jgi:hypothetical protein
MIQALLQEVFHHPLQVAETLEVASAAAAEVEVELQVAEVEVQVAAQEVPAEQDNGENPAGDCNLR